MRPLKQVGLRLTEDLLARVDEHQEAAGDSRSETLRRLVEMGLDRDRIDRKLTAVETRLDRLDVVFERIHQLVYITAGGLLEISPKMAQNMETLRTKAKSDLANLLVNHFGQ